MLFAAFAAPAGLRAQDADGTAPPPPVDTSAPAVSVPDTSVPAISEEEARIAEMEIKTSTLIELAEWCRLLGISEGGSREELANRLRDKFSLPRPDGTAAPEQKVVTIESARTTEYFTVAAVGEEYARLSGGVNLSLADGDSRHRIKAWEIMYNRTRNILTASGNVEYVKESGDTQETFKGESITINLDTWIGSFIDTISEKTISGSETAYRFAGQVISQTDKDTTVLTKARVTNAKTDEPFWSLDAGKLWVLPGSDWALANATLRVGEIPVLWMPFFFFPVDEMVIHPALGTRTREGSFFQSTTYIFGRPAADALTENSITQIMGSGEGMERTREGLFLRTTGRKASTTDTRKFSIIADAYTNLGFYTGTEISLPKLGPINNFTLSAGLAFTRTIFQPGGAGTAYTPYNVQYDAKDHWDGGYMFGQQVPFRYRFTTSPGISGKYGSITLSLPYYSDPFINYDVMNRSESIDWMEMIKEGAARPEDPDTTSTNQGAFEWTMTARPNFSTSALSPVISSLSISNISSVYHFNYKNNTELPSEFSAFSPERNFYYPDKFTLYSISGSMGGTPLTLSGATTTAAKDAEVPDALKDFGPVKSPWDAENAASSASASSSSALTAAASSAAAKGQKPFSLDVPTLTQTFDTAKNSGLRFTWNYSLTPTSASELNYSAQDWAEPGDIDLSDISSILVRVRTDGSTTFTLSEANNNLFSLTGGLTGSWQWQEHSYLNEEAEEYKDDTGDKIKNEKFADYRATIWTTSWTHGTTITPFYASPSWKTTNFQYTLAGLLARSNFLEAESTADDPKWETIYGSWDKDNITTHRVAANFGVSILDKMQSLQLYSDVWPREPLVGMNSTLNAWISTTTVGTTIKEPFDGAPQYQPATFSETLTFKSGYTANQYLVYDPAYSDWTSFNSTLTLGTFTAIDSGRSSASFVSRDTQPVTVPVVSLLIL